MVNNMAGITREEMVARRILPKFNNSVELCSADIVMILKDNKVNYWRR